MAENLIRAQIKPDAGVWERLYDVNGPTTISTIHFCNAGYNTDRVDVRFALQGADEDDAQYVASQVIVPSGLPYAMTEGFTLLESDVVWVRSAQGTTAFSLFGVEVT